VIDRAVGNTNRYFISNAPVGHFQYAYTDALQAQRKNFGAKVFFYRAQLLAGSVKLETKLYTDYAWIARYVYKSVMFSVCHRRFWYVVLHKFLTWIHFFFSAQGRGEGIF
jgi:hypothetical protein